MKAEEKDLLLKEELFNKHRIHKKDATVYCMCLGEFLRALKDYDEHSAQERYQKARMSISHITYENNKDIMLALRIASGLASGLTKPEER